MLFVFSLTFLITYINASEVPIIGILSQEAYLVSKAYPDAHSFIAASYVKLLESSGARVLPIWIGQDESYYERVVKYTNGVLFPGGGTFFNESKGYGEASRQIYKFAMEVNDKGEYFPLWGICLGMQALMFDDLGSDIRGTCEAKDISLPLVFDKDYLNSRLFSKAPAQILECLETKNITYNYHRYCLFEKDLKDANLLKNWKILSRNKDKNNLEFVSTMEHTRYPFYGTQYHPEKNPYEFKGKTAVSHSSESIEVSHYFSDFFVNESRKNNHSFAKKDLEDGSLIYNYNAVYSAYNTSYEQLYLFYQNDYVKNLL